MHRSRFLRALAALPLLAASLAWGQAFPQRPVTIVVPYTAGGPTDAAARLVADELAQRTGQAFVVQNKPGAGTMLGTEAVRRAAPDGYTWLLGTTTTFSLNPVLYPKLGYARDDFAVIGAVAKVPYAVVVSSRIPAKNMREFAAWTKAQASGYTFGTVGPGSPPHIIGVVLAKALGVAALPVHYKGSAPVQVDLAGGVIDVSIDPLITAMPMHQAGKARIIAIIDDKRWPDLPEVPTLAEQGIATVQGYSWFGLFAPAGTPREVVSSMGGLAESIAAKSGVEQKLRTLGLAPLALGRSDFEQLMRADAAWWKGVAEANNIRLE